jgi:protein ImuB
MLWVCLHLPDLALEIFTRASSNTDPLVVCEGTGRAQQVLAANSAAQRQGIRPGMRVSAALALNAALRVRAREPRAEAAALDSLAAWAGQFSSLVSVVEPQALLLEVGGSLRLFRGLEALLSRIELGLAELGYHAQFGVAPTPLAATWLARGVAEAQVTELAELGGALTDLPLDVLDLAPGEREGFEGMGVRQIGDVLRLPRDGLAKRWGTELVTALDRALGRLADPRRQHVPAASHEAQLALPGSVDTVEAVVFALNRLVQELAGVLRARVAGVQEVVLILRHPGIEETRVPLGLVAPTRDPRHLLELFREQLARTTLRAPVETLVLSAPRLAPYASSNLDLFGSRLTATEAAGALIERLRARLGARAVQGVSAVAEHRPEFAFRYAEPGEASTLVDSGARPFWLLPEPLPLEVRDGRPWLGGTLEFEGDGERIESGWWDGREVARDYFTARNVLGERYWVFRDLPEAQHWWLHGVFG